MLSLIRQFNRAVAGSMTGACIETISVTALEKSSGISCQLVPSATPETSPTSIVRRPIRSIMSLGARSAAVRQPSRPARVAAGDRPPRSPLARPVTSGGSSLPRLDRIPASNDSPAPDARSFAWSSFTTKPLKTPLLLCARKIRSGLWLPRARPPAKLVLGLGERRAGGRRLRSSIRSRHLGRHGDHSVAPGRPLRRLR
jgi:hypothetical protein